MHTPSPLICMHQLQAAVRPFCKHRLQAAVTLCKQPLNSSQIIDCKLPLHLSACICCTPLSLLAWMSRSHSPRIFGLAIRQASPPSPSIGTSREADDVMSAAACTPARVQRRARARMEGAEQGEQARSPRDRHDSKRREVDCNGARSRDVRRTRRSSRGHIRRWYIASSHVKSSDRM